MEEGKRQLESSLQELQGQSERQNKIITDWERRYKKLEDELSILDSQRHMTGLEASQLGTKLGDA
jgi:hypothetical protein